MIEVCQQDGIDYNYVDQFQSINAVLDNYSSTDILAIDRYGTAVTVWIK